jgi:hypothetical protein
MALARWAREHSALLVAGVFSAGVLVACVVGGAPPRQAAKELRVRDFLRAARQWMAAAKADSDVVAALLHAAYADAYVNAARALLPDADIEAATGAPLPPLVAAVRDTQRVAVDAVLRQRAAPEPRPLKAPSSAYRAR